MAKSTLIVTLALDEQAQSYFNLMRQLHYPKHFNYTNAHLTLFHTLPAGNPEVIQAIEASAGRKQVYLTVTGLQHTGKGVSFIITSPELNELHMHLQECFSGLLTEKDTRLLKPHVTIQHKVTAYRAAKLFEHLQAGFSPFACTGIGFSTYIYAKGPWIHAGDFLFKN
mgnify:CR=1 FL=1